MNSVLDSAQVVSIKFILSSLRYFPCLNKGQHLENTSNHELYFLHEIVCSFVVTYMLLCALYM